MKAAEFLQKLDESKTQFNQAITDLDADRASQAGAVNGWSIKDLVAHIAWYEQEMVELLEMRTLAGSDLWGLDHAERNARIYDLNKNRSWEDVKSEAEEVYAGFWEAAQSLRDEELVDASHFRDMPAEWVPWQIMADNSFRHYDEHLDELRGWLDN